MEIEKHKLADRVSWVNSVTQTPWHDFYEPKRALSPGHLLFSASRVGSINDYGNYPACK